MTKNQNTIKSDDDITLGTTKEEEDHKVNDIIDLFYLKQRVLFLDSDINDDTTTQFIKLFKMFEIQNSSKEITIYINSEGGDIYCALAIYDLIQKSTCPVRTITIGKAMSAGAWILLAGTSGLRFAYENARIMLHEGSAFMFGEERISNIDVQNEENKLMHRLYIDILKRHTKIDKDYKEIKQWLIKDIYMSSEEAKEMGIIDEIIKTRKTSK